jgi:hypothetical protein
VTVTHKRARGEPAASANNIDHIIAESNGRVFKSVSLAQFFLTKHGFSLARFDGE